MRILKYTLAGIALAGVAACGSIPGVGGGADGSSVVSKAQAEVDNLKGSYVVAKGLLDELLASTEALPNIPADVRPAKLVKGALTGALNDCVNAPMEAVTGVKSSAVNLANAAKAFKQKTGLRELKATKTAVANAMATTKKCQPNMSTVSRWGKGTTEPTKKFVTDKVDAVNRIRVIGKKAFPNQVVAMLESAKSTPAAVAKAIAELELLAKNPTADKKAVSKNLNAAKKLQSDVTGLATMISKDGPTLSARATSVMSKLPSKFASSFGEAKKK